MLRSSRVLAFAATLVAIPAVEAAPLLIDDFDTPFASGPVSLTSTGFSTRSDAPTMGEPFVTRGVVVTLDSSGDPSGVERLFANVSGGAFAYGSDPRIDGNLQLGYSLPLLDLSDYTTIRLSFGVLDATTSIYALAAGPGGANAKTVIAPAGSSFVDIDFSTLPFNPLSSPLDGLTFTIDAPQASDFTLNSVQAVPEPTTFAALAAGSLLVLRRKKRVGPQGRG